MQEIMQRIQHIARGAGNILMDMRVAGFEVMQKSDTGNAACDIVTEADLKADAYIRTQLAKHFPHEQILTEETVNECVIDRSQPTRIVDPLDGTKNFSENNDTFGVLIGKIVGGIPVLGVAYFPALEKMYSAHTGGGAWCNGEKIHTQNTIYTIEQSGPHPIELNNKLTKFSTLRCSGMSLSLIAEGLLGGVYKTHSRNGKRDTCASHIILQEAGGIITDCKNKPLDYTQTSPYRGDGYLAGNKALHKEIVTNIQK